LDMMYIYGKKKKREYKDRRRALQGVDISF
jgi:hypothetical protein